ncbi:helix-turn-helix domain-containing protein [Streptomyces sp. NPDC050509]|uniref:helix-turn-helix domain-containing protein n=1 Tax=Streptomyces sp. NPDC050509 TaxID=3365620 RepID=UPI0037A90839
MTVTNQSAPTPSAALRPWIADISVLTVAGFGQRPFTHLPDTATALVFRTTAAGRSDLLVMGPRTRASYRTGKDVPFCLKVRIRPGRARPLLGVPVGELADRVVPLGELWGGSADRLAHELAHLGPDPALVLEHLEAELLARLTTRTPADLLRSDLLHTATQALTTRAHQRPERVPALAERLGVSERHLRTLFTDGVGLSPKHLARIERVRSVLARRPGRRHWAQLATESGYYDQSHMTADFHDVMGAPPQAFHAGHRPPAQPC